MDWRNRVDKSRARSNGECALIDDLIKNIRMQDPHIFEHLLRDTPPEESIKLNEITARITITAAVSETDKPMKRLYALLINMGLEISEIELCHSQSIIELDAAMVENFLNRQNGVPFR